MIILLLWILLVGDASSMTIKIEPKTKECYMEDLVKGTEYTLQFQVTAGGLYDIDVHLYSPDHTLLKSWGVATEGKHTWVTEREGKYLFCLSNEMAKWTPKWVSFSLSQTNNPDLAKLEHIDPIERTIMELSEGLNDLQEEQHYLRSVERIHRQTIDATNVRMLYWSMFEVLVLLSMGLFQIYYLKRFLEVKSSV
eukprot:NODE_4593_length_765_cov_36.423197_g4434_i0.p1 GENE.NODE_4593_length_765_cov_36.423197_g4434_i0~~NODE_4593_length_765_cov_36.423197_g4434_i0.p1  ORF type:complete len:195 (+),score=60.56 NODE_4593_length_765_cov_36.423197_g4434_i0:38-622(+)